MKSDGAVELKHYNDIPEDQWAEIFKKIELIESNSWVAEKGTSKFIGHSNQLFWNSLITDEWFRRSLNILILYFDEKPVSYSVDMDTEYTRYGISTGYNKEVSKYRVGAIIFMATIVQAIELGKKIFDTGIGDGGESGDGGGYKTDFGAEKFDAVVEIIAFPPTIIGRAI
jgi:CelD/BcsL family acetyltransferase involved in cellulose biosynthesis